MHFKKISTLFVNTNWSFKKFSNPQQDPQNIYRIVDVNQSPTGQLTILIQIIGKSTVIACTPQEIIENDRMIEGFSKKDIRAITYYAFEHKNKPRYKIVMQEFCEAFNKILFKIKKQNSLEIISKTAGQISLDKTLLNNLSQEDACCISYTAGYEQASLEQPLLSKNRKQNLRPT